MYGIRALFFAVPLLGLMSSRKLLFFCMSCMVAYVLSYLIMAYLPTMTPWGPYFGSAIGGLASGALWPAQGAYFAAAAAIHAERTRTSQIAATSALAGRFGAIFLGLEFACKLGATLILYVVPTDPTAAVASQTVDVTHGVIFGVLAFASAIATALFLFVTTEMPSPAKSSREDPAEIGGTFLSAIRLWRDEPTPLLLLTPFNLSFGLLTAFLVGDVNSAIAVPVFGKRSVGLLNSISVAVGAVCSYAFANCCCGCEDRDHKGRILAACAGCYLLELLVAGIAFGMVESGNTTSGPGSLLIWCYVLHGAGRAAFESVNKALAVDLLPERTAAAFANITLVNAVASAFGFFAFPRMPRGLMIGICALPCLCSIPAALTAAQRVRDSTPEAPAKGA